MGWTAKQRQIPLHKRLILHPDSHVDDFRVRFGIHRIGRERGCPVRGRTKP